MIWIISLFAYLFIGGVLGGLFNGADEELNFGSVFFWPIVLVVWFGDEVGQFIRKMF